MKLDCSLAMCTILLGLGALATDRGPTHAPGYYTDPGAWIWLDAGVDPVLQPGDEVRVYFRAASDGFAAVFRLDTAGRLHLLFPADPTADGRVLGGHDYRLLFPDAPLWKVNDAPGTGHFFLLASEAPLDLSGASHTEPGGWALAGVTDARFADPHAAMDVAVEALLPDWEGAVFRLTFLSYHIGEEAARSHRMCYDCLPLPATESRGAPSELSERSRPVLERRLPGGVIPPPGG